MRQLEATVQADQANVEAAQVQLDYTTIKAPLVGTHRHPAARPGQHRSRDRHDRSCRHHAIAADLGDFHPAAGPTAGGHPSDDLEHRRRSRSLRQGRDDQQQLGEGRSSLSTIVIDQTTGSVRLKATFPNKDYALWPGQYVNIRLLLRPCRKPSPCHPTAVQRGPDGMYVYIVKPDSTVAMQPCRVGQMTDGTSVIEKGLDAGTPIVIAGQYRLQPGSRIQTAADAAKLASAE